MAIHDEPDGHEPQPGSTAYLLQEMQLYGHRPFEDEPDHRPLPDDRAAAGAVADMFDALVSCLIDTRIEPDLEDLAWGIVNVFHRASERIEREPSQESGTRLGHLSEQHVQREPDREIEDHADHGRRDRRKRAGEAAIAAQLLNERRAGEDPQHRGRERHPRGHHGAENAGNDR